MPWYAAHVIMCTMFKDGHQEVFPVWEDIILVNAVNPDVAKEKASNRAREDEGDSSGSYTYDGRPATWVFSGIRKLIECQDPDDTPGDGTEITYSVFQIDTEDALQKLVEGESVTLRYEE